ncbi:hypothetical protein [Streptomyces sp. NPDC007094]|uniref:hypothetical protein n=1 Tax=Streptomyces sp. NPDC007094 TaxID=3155359 RepID=UPI0033EEEA29
MQSCCIHGRPGLGGGSHLDRGRVRAVPEGANLGGGLLGGLLTGGWRVSLVSDPFDSVAQDAQGLKAR